MLIVHKRPPEPTVIWAMSDQKGQNMEEPERFLTLDETSLSDAQRQAREAFLAGPRGVLTEPFNTLLRSPGLFDVVQRVGEYIRFHSALPAKLRELAILVTARHWTAQFEWLGHSRIADEAGLAPAIISAIAEGHRPAAMSEDEAAVHDFACSLVRTGEVSDVVFADVRERFGEAGVVDLVGVVGYYTLISMVLNVARTRIPGGAVPLKPVR